MNIGSAAERSGVPPKTIRYYESIGLIAAADRRANNYRDYSESDVQTLRFIHRARSLGFSVKEVAGLLALWRDRRRASHDVKALALAHVDDIDRKIAELQSMRRTLTELTERCHGDQRPECPILDDLAGGDVPERRRGQATVVDHRQAGAGR
jgi:MerR family copper efflux transcriptional regulator